jgi:hypothetical protein
MAPDGNVFLKARFRTRYNPGMGKPSTDKCDNCGRAAPGRGQWMAYEYGFYRQFYCFLCRGWMRWYAIAALVLLAAAALATIGYIWRSIFLRG